MYQVEESKNRTDMKNYLENYVDVTGFLECCRQCECYGQVWSCPPYDFDPEEYWKKYKYIYIIGTKIIFDRSMTGEKTEEETKKYLEQVFIEEKKILHGKLLALEKKYPGSVGLSAGSCHICEECARSVGEACLFPGEMRYSVESLGGNVVKTAEDFLGIKLKWTDGKLPEYLTLVNAFLTDDPEAEL